MLTTPALPCPRIIFNNTIEREKFIWENNTYPHWFAMILISGSYEVTMRGVRAVAREDDVVIFAPGVPFMRRIIKPITSLYIHFDWDGAPDSEADFGTLYPCGLLEFIDRRRIAENCSLLRETANIRTPEALALSGHYFCDIWYEYCRLRSARSLNGMPEISDSVTVEAIKYLSENFAASITIAELAKHAGMSHVGFTNRFVRSTGITPVEYLTRVRMRSAAELLTATDLPIGDIARRCGYENPFYFSRVFRDRMGMPPSEYRRVTIL